MGVSAGGGDLWRSCWQLFLWSEGGCVVCATWTQFWHNFWQEGWKHEGMTVRVERDCDADERTHACGLSAKMAIMTRLAVEAFPSADAQCVGARCPLVKSNRPMLDVESPRFRTQSTQSNSPLKKKSSARTSSFEKKGPTWSVTRLCQLMCALPARKHSVLHQHFLLKKQFYAFCS